MASHVVPYKSSVIPDNTFDITKGYIVGDIISVIGGSLYSCQVNTFNSAVWDLIGGSSTIITVSNNSVFDFGNEGDYSANIIANASLTNANFKSFSWFPIETAETSIDDFKLNAVSFVLESITDNTNFTIRGTSDNGATGNYTIKYVITY